MVSKAFRNVEKVKDPNDGAMQVVYAQSSTAYSPLSTAYTEIAGSKISFTPKVTGSEVLYNCSIQVSSVDTHSIGHFWVQTSEDGTNWTNRVRRGSSINASASMTHLSFTYRLTGNVANDARYFRVIGRSYSTGNEVRVGQTYYWDGVTSYQAADTCAWAIEFVNQTVVS